MFLLTEQNIFALQCTCVIWWNIAIIIQIHQEVYGSLNKRDEVPANNDDLTQSFKYKAALTGKNGKF